MVMLGRDSALNEAEHVAASAERLSQLQISVERAVRCVAMCRTIGAVRCPVGLLALVE